MYDFGSVLANVFWSNCNIVQSLYVDLTASSIAFQETSCISIFFLHLSLLSDVCTMITQLSIPTHAQLQSHRLKFIKNHLKTPTSFGLRPSSGSYNVLAKITII